MKRESMIIAHRGESYDAPENTLAAINLAWERGAKAVECDVHLSKDNQIMVIHDDNTLRTTGIDKRVTEQTCEELIQLDAGSWKDVKWNDVKIPTLNEILETIPSNGKLLIEVKCDAKIIPVLKDLLDNSQIDSEQIVLMDFNFETVSEMKKVFRNYEVLWLSTMQKWKFFQIKDSDLIRKALYAGLNGLNFMAQKRIDEYLVEDVHRSGLKLYVWTVDDPEEAKRLIDLGVNGIATNRAAWLKSQIV